MSAMSAIVLKKALVITVLVCHARASLADNAISPAPVPVIMHAAGGLLASPPPTPHVLEEYRPACGEFPGGCGCHGVCVSGSCQCVGGYHGGNCSAAPDPCVYPAVVRCGTGSAGCVGGKCAALPEGEPCQILEFDGALHANGACKECASGLSGLNCTDANECASTPCRNGGRCYQSADVLADLGAAHAKLQAAWEGRYVCSCQAGFGGSDCRCPDCGVRGVCQPNGRCQCIAGFVGALCEVSTECASSPCQHGSCSARDSAAYTCTCGAGWDGVNCDIDVAVEHAAKVQYAATLQHTAALQHAVTLRHAAKLQHTATLRHAAEMQHAASVQHTATLRHAATLRQATSLQHSATLRHAVTLRHAAKLQHTATLRHAAKLLRHKYGGSQ